MSNFLPKNPAWSEIHAHDLNLVIACANVSSIINNLFNGSSEIYKIKRTHQEGFYDEIEGHYRFKANNKEYFVKIVNLEEHDQLCKSNDISIELCKAGISTFMLIDSFPKKFNKNLFLHVYPFIESRFFRCTEGDITLIAKELSKLHKAFKKNKDSNIIKKSTHKREMFLKTDFNKKIELLKQIDLTASNYLLKYKNILFKEFTNRQVTHGDLNYHNIIFDTKRNTLVLLDFEFTTHSYFSPLFDIAKVLERFILLRDIDNASKVSFAKVLISQISYKSFDKSDLYDMLLFISLHSLLILATGIYLEKRTVNFKEINKFKSHIQFIENNKKLINQLVD